MLFLFITIGTVCNGCKISDTGTLSTTAYGTDGALLMGATTQIGAGQRRLWRSSICSSIAEPTLSCCLPSAATVKGNNCRAKSLHCALGAGVLVCPLTNARVVEIALVFGFSIATLVYCSASFSGAHARATHVASSASAFLQHGKQVGPAQDFLHGLA